MADETQFEVLTLGVQIWNEWRAENTNETLDLSHADLRGANLIQANLSNVNLREANLSGVNLFRAGLQEADLREVNFDKAYLREADLRGANLFRASLRETDLRRANLFEVNLSEGILDEADLRGANLSRSLIDANLIEADLSWTDLRGANLSGANLIEADLSQTDLRGAIIISCPMVNADITDAHCGNTSFSFLDLSRIKGLETIQHHSPSSIDTYTLYTSQGKIPDVFLRGCGVPENLITFLPSLIGKGIEFYSCFISYSHDDKEFARRLHDRLQGEGIRCWLDEHQLNPGDPLHPTIYEAIRVYDKVLLCCSETALRSWWVDKEFNRAMSKEQDYNDLVLIPLNLDGYLFNPACTGWLADEMKRRLVADFTGWKNHDGFENAVKTVIKALRTDGSKLPLPEPKLKPKR